MALIPFECNPEVMSKFLQKVGVPTKWNMVDVYSLDPDLLAIISRPVLALVLLYPMTDKTEAYQGDLGKNPPDDKKIKTDGVYHLKQLISNACGTIALIHSVVNNLDKIKLEDGFLKKFYEETKDVDFEKRGEILCNSDDLVDVHKELSVEGQSEAPNEDTPSTNHFVAFVEKNGTIYELDGRKPHPIDHGPSSPDTFLEDAARVLGEYMKRDPDDVRFSIVALVARE